MNKRSIQIILYEILIQKFFEAMYLFIVNIIELIIEIQILKIFHNILNKKVMLMNLMLSIFSD